MNFRHYRASVRLHWSDFWSIPGRRLEFIFSFALLTLVMVGMLRFLRYNEARTGHKLHDPLMAIFEPIDLSGLTFLLLYLGLIYTIIMLLQQPGRLLVGLQIYTVYAALRILAMYIVPLEPPEGMIPLADPLLQWAQTGSQLNKDLFFSGHTATLFICYLMLSPGRWRSVFLAGVLVMAACLVIQRVHYSIDVVAAPFFCFGAYAFVLRIRKLANSAPHLERH